MDDIIIIGIIFVSLGYTIQISDNRKIIKQYNDLVNKNIKNIKESYNGVLKTVIDYDYSVNIVDQEAIELHRVKRDVKISEQTSLKMKRHDGLFDIGILFTIIGQILILIGSIESINEPNIEKLPIIGEYILAYEKYALFIGGILGLGISIFETVDLVQGDNIAGITSGAIAVIASIIIYEEDPITS
jgi:hypothetical protein